jgi:glutamate-1-semialdehyde 2,1-aminomutase
LADGLQTAAKSAGVEHCLNRVGSMMTLFFNPGPVTAWESASRCDTGMFSKYFWGMIERGVYMPCSQFEALFVSATHSDEDIQNTIDAATEVLANVCV